jgi:hypothetical protein
MEDWKEMRFDYLLIGFLMISLFAVGGTLMIGDMNAEYTGIIENNVSTSDFSGVYNQTNKIYELAQSAKNQTLDADIDGGSTSIDSMIRGSYAALRLIGSTFGLFNAMAWAISDSFGIPEWIVTIAFTIFIISIIFSLIYMLFRYVSN